MLSPVLSDRWMVLDFGAHSITVKQWKEPVSLGNYRGKWVNKLVSEFGYSDDEAKALVLHMERMTEERAPNHKRDNMNKLVSMGIPPYLWLREQEPNERVIPVPSRWMSALKRHPFPNVPCPF